MSDSFRTSDMAEGSVLRSGLEARKKPKPYKPGKGKKIARVFAADFLGEGKRKR